MWFPSQYGLLLVRWQVWYDSVNVACDSGAPLPNPSLSHHKAGLICDIRALVTRHDSNSHSIYFDKGVISNLKCRSHHGMYIYEF